MKTFSFLILVFLFASGLSAQNNSKNNLPSKAEPKTHKDSARINEYRLTSNLIDSMNFVLQADLMTYGAGQPRISVNKSLNFILVDSLWAVLQTGKNDGMGGNGVGGSTVEGKITSWKVNKDEKHMSFMITMDVSSKTGVYTIFIDIIASGKATARLRTNASSQVIWEGSIVPNEKSIAYKGRAL
jgi:hypothetical protein